MSERDAISEEAVEAGTAALLELIPGECIHARPNGCDLYLCKCRREVRAILSAALPLIVAGEREIKPGDVFGDDLVAIPIADYSRLIMAAEDDDMLIWCEVCGAWIDREDEACASTEDFRGCWKVASAAERDGHLCRSYRAVRDIRADKGGE